MYKVHAWQLETTLFHTDLGSEATDQEFWGQFYKNISAKILDLKYNLVKFKFVSMYVFIWLYSIWKSMILNIKILNTKIKNTKMYVCLCICCFWVEVCPKFDDQ
jgi:hypothetical protein